MTALPNDPTPEAGADAGEGLTGSLDVVQDWLRDRILERVGGTLRNREAYWQRSDVTRPRPDDVRRLYRAAATKNALTAGGATFVPGPVGVLTVPPELLLTLSLTVRMVYDIAVAHGVEDRVDTETVVAVALSDTNRGVLGYVFDEGDPKRARRPANRIGGKLATLLARATMIRLLRAVFGRVVPVVGAAGAAWWVRSNTLAVGRRADALFKRELAEGTDAETEALEHQLDADLAAPMELEEPPELQQARHALFANAMRHSPGPSESQRAHFDALAADWGGVTNLDDAAACLSADADLRVDLPLLAEHVTAEELFAELGAFGSLGDGVSLKWAAELGRSFGLTKSDVDDLLEADEE